MKAPLPPYELATTPLAELMRYVGSKRELGRARVRFADTDVTIAG